MRMSADVVYHIKESSSLLHDDLLSCRQNHNDLLFCRQNHNDSSAAFGTICNADRLRS